MVRDAEVTPTAPAPVADPPPESLPPVVLREGLPPLTDTPAALEAVATALAAGSGPIAVDTERASGYRYSQRAYLVQLRRARSGTFLVDPIACPGVPGLAAALTGPEWVLHAASQDLPCLADLGLRPTSLFDTELAGRLLGLPRVGLGPIVEDLLGMTLAKGHGAADWSRRPLPDAWLEYAALDVEVLLELRDVLAERLLEAGKAGWARQEFDAVRDAAPPAPRVDPWRRTSGLHRVRSRRGLAVVQQLWQARDRVARETDVAPGRILPDSSLVAAAVGLPRDLDSMLALRDFHGRGATRHRRDWGQALRAAWALPEPELPPAAGRGGDGPPPPRTWAQRDPAAAARLERARAALKDIATARSVPVENLLTPELVRRLMWQPPDPAGADDVASVLRAAGARPWQVELTAAPLATAITTTP